MAEWAVSNEPPIMLFNDVNALVDSAKASAAENMTSLFKKRSDHGKVVLKCSHGGMYQPVKMKVAEKGRTLLELVQY
jgi:hypothetical protein